MIISKIFSLIWSYLDIYTIGIPIFVWWITQFLIWKGYIFSKGNKPYGVYGLPLLGSVIHFVFGSRTAFEILEDDAKKYGPVVRYRFGTTGVTMVNGTKAVREGMLNDDILGRPPQANGSEELDKLFDFKSLINLENDLWKKHRRFSLITLRDLGFGKTAIMEENIQAEIRELLRIIEEKRGEGFDIQELIMGSASNNINSLVYGERLPFESPKRKEFNDVLTGFTVEAEKIISVALVPKLLTIMHKLNVGIVARLKNYVNRFRQLQYKAVEEHRANLDKDNPKDYLDHYLIEQEKDKDFTEELVGGNAMAFFSAGTSTVRLTVEYLMHLMAHLPEIQKKVQNEIDEVTGRSRDVTWADSSNMVYTMAVIAERHRYNTVAPTGVPRRSLRNTKICGYDIPAFETIVFNLDSVHYDTQQFENPYEFKPERFIDANGKLYNTEKVWAFSIGKRACPGESLAVLEVFLYFTMILQNFNIVADEPVKFRPLRSLLAETVRQKIRLIRRE